MKPVHLFNVAENANFVQQDVLKHWEQILTSGKFTLGPFTEQFEDDFGTFCVENTNEATNPFVIPCNSGTDALSLLVRAHTPKPSTVTVPALTFVATAEAVINGAVGGLPTLLLTDVDNTGLIAHHTTRGISIGVDLWGLPCNPNYVDIVDSCQGHGLDRTGCNAAYSFYPTKNVGAAGDAGAVVTWDRTLANKIRMLANHGRVDQNTHALPGYNSRMDEVQAAFLIEQLKYQRDDLEARRQNAATYQAGLCSELADFASWCAPNRGVWHVFPVLVEDRNRFIAKMAEHKIFLGTHYPTPLHLQPAFAGIYTYGDFPNAERIAEHQVSLPCHPGLTEQQIEFVIDTANKLI